MNDDLRIKAVTRKGFLKLLSEAEIASVSAAEAARLASNDDEHVDLEHLDEGVRGAPDATTALAPSAPPPHLRLVKS